MRAKLVNDYKSLGKYAYCGHSVILGHFKTDWQGVEWVLKLFNEKVRESRRQYREFVRKGIAQGSRSDLIGGGLIRSAGG